MGNFSTIKALAFSTYREVVTRPFYYVILLLLAGMILFSKFITLFSFHQETNMVREMGIASVAFFSFLITIVLSGTLVTKELENRTAITLLSKPISREGFLIGKFFGLTLAMIPGLIVLCGVLILTLWWMTEPAVFGNDTVMWRLSHPPAGVEPARVMVENQPLLQETIGCLDIAWKFSLKTNILLALQGTLLAFFQGSILAAICISLSAFFPVLVSASATATFFILGNLSTYLVGSMEAWNHSALSFCTILFVKLLPNLGYFNLQTYFNEGRIISGQYIGLTALYCLLYCFAVFLLSCSAFRRREIR